DGIAHLDELPTGTFDLLAIAPLGSAAQDAPAQATDAAVFLSDERITLAAGENGPFDVPCLERRPVSLHFSRSDGGAVARAKIAELMGMSGPVETASDDGMRLRALDLESDSDGVLGVELYPGEYRLVAGVGGLKCDASFTVPRRGPDMIEVALGDAFRVG